MIDGPRGLMPDELDKLMEELVNIVYSPNMRGAFPTLFCRENAEDLRIIKVDGRIVSHIGIVVRDMILNGCRISVGNVGAVCTHEDYRNRGYAWSIMEDAMEKFRAKGVDMFLISGFRNLYRLHGATHVGKVAQYHVKTDTKLPETGPEVQSFSPEDLPAWSALHRSEPVRFHRPYDDFQKLTSIMPAHRGRRLYSIRENGRIAAYAVLVKSREGHGYLNEYAGSRWALTASLKALCEEASVPGIGVSVLPHDTGFGGLLESIGAEVSYGSTGGTIAILDFPRLCERLRPMFEETVGSETAQKMEFRERDGLYVISLGEDEVVIGDAHDAARLIFGDPPDRDERTEIAAQSRLSEVLDAIFPVPRPEYGLSYI